MRKENPVQILNLFFSRSYATIFKRKLSKKSCPQI
ncbi:MAG: hypothetical protein ACI85O_002596, partial [Saprospiraceae bacterium]